MKWWFKVKQNRLYRKYNFDPHGYLLRRSKFNRVCKNILIIYRKKLLSTYARSKKRLLKQSRVQIIKKNSNKRKRRRFKLRKKTKNKKLNYLNKWHFDFWNKFVIGYYGNKFLKRKNSFNKLRIVKRRVISSKLNAMKFYMRRARRSISKPGQKLWGRRKKISSPAKFYYKKKRKKFLNKLTWLRVRRVFKRQKSWWLMRVQVRKAAFFYGFTSLRKFRYINNLNNKAMPLKTYYYFKLECMINMFLFRLNMFDNIYIVNNFIRVSNIVLINDGEVRYPYRVVKLRDIVSFKKTAIKRMQSIFKKRAMYNKSFLVRKHKALSITVSSLRKARKIFSNIPPYIYYDMRIMKFSMYRMPKRKEFLGLVGAFDWSIETQLQYN